MITLRCEFILTVKGAAHMSLVQADRAERMCEAHNNRMRVPYRHVYLEQDWREHTVLLRGECLRDLQFLAEKIERVLAQAPRRRVAG